MKDGIIYITSENGYLYALNKNGKLEWKLNVNSTTTPSISPNGIFLINNKGYLISVKEGKIVWNYNLYGVKSPAFDRNTVYAVSSKGILYAIKSDGTLKWTFKASSSINTPPLVDLSGTVYFSTDKGLVYAVNGHGIKKWSFKLKYGRAIYLNISSENFLDIVSDAGYIYVFGE
jgi:outer membrane protein assembly factor BamB